MTDFKYLGFILLTIFILWLPFGQASNEVYNYRQLRESDFQGIADKIHTKIRDYAKKTLQAEKIEEQLKKLNYIVKTVDGQTLETDFSAGLESVFNGKQKILENIKHKAEKAEMDYNYDQTFDEEHAYFNMRDIKTQYNENQSLVIVPKFSDNVRVNFTHSFVQVPTNVYAYKKSVLDQVTWGAELDETFEGNFKNSSGSLLYQYFGDASTGIFRIFPGNIMGVKEDEHKTDLYDCRRRVWYIQAAASAKDIVIVLDLSGSMIGNNIGIAKIAISSLIDTLQENDYFNVITINTEVKYIVPCIKYLIQATKENKEMMKRVVQNLTEAAEIVDVNKGMDEAFKILNIGPSINRTSAGCNKAIMFVTDGIEGTYAGQESFEKNNPNKDVRVFSYLVGRIKNPNEKALKKMSCENNGFFYKIETLGNIWDTVLDYIRVMSRPLIPNLKDSGRKELKPTYTPAYLDSAGFGMVMTISLSVFKKISYIHNEDPNDVRYLYEGFLGVAGTDISLKNLKDQVDQSKLGVFSRGFVINNNGFVLIHPKFRDQSGYLPVPPNVLIDELESAQDQEDTSALKKQMLKLTADDLEGGPVEFITRSTYDDGRKVYSGKTKYWYKLLPDADLVSALALDEIDNTYLAVDESTLELKAIKEKGIEALKPPVDDFDYDYWNLTKTNTSFVTIAPWNYCNLPESLHNKPLGMKFYPTVGEIYTFMSKNPTDYEKHCKDKELVTRLLAMAGVTSETVDKIWSQFQFDEDPDMIQGAFFATSSGYQKYLSYHNHTDPSPPFNRDILRTKVFETPITNPDINLFLSSSARDKTVGPVKISIMHPFWKQKNIAAVTGIEINSQLIYNYLMESAEIKMTEFSTLAICKDTENAFCGVIDEHGYIITSNQGEAYTGQFIGERLGEIVDALPFFTKIELEDAQAECPLSDEVSAANILLTPAKLIFGFITGLCKTCYWLVIQFGIVLISLFEHAQRVYAEVPKTIRVSCTKTMPFYQFDMSKIQNGKIFQETYKCEDCSDKTKDFKLIRINDTNTMLLMAEADSNCCYKKRVSMNHVKKDSTIDWCNPPEQPYRRSPAVCLNDTTSKPENAKCGSGFVEKPSILVLTIAFMLVCFVFG